MLNGVKLLPAVFSTAAVFAQIPDAKSGAYTLPDLEAGVMHAGRHGMTPADWDAFLQYMKNPFKP